MFEVCMTRYKTMLGNKIVFTQNILFPDQTTLTVSILETKVAWESCVHTAENVFRKEEPDWKMAYLARFEDTENAKIKWAFKFNESNLRIKDISLKFETKTYENGAVDIKYLHKGQCYYYSA